MTKELVQFWKGKEKAYRELYVRGRIKDNVRYTVIQEDGTIKEYLGKKIINNCDLEQIAALDDVISIDTYNENYSKGKYKNCRLLVGDNNAFDSDGKLMDAYEPSSDEHSLWYAVIFDNGTEPLQIIDFTEKTARIKSYGMKEYQVVNGMLTTYDQLVWNNK